MKMQNNLNIYNVACQCVRKFDCNCLCFTVNTDYKDVQDDDIAFARDILCYYFRSERGTAGAGMSRRLPLSLLSHQLGDGLLR